MSNSTGNGIGNPSIAAAAAAQLSIATNSSLSTLPLNKLQVSRIRHDVDEITWYFTYASTTILIVALHLVFVYHWLRRKPRHKLLASYRTLVQRKQYHRALIALLSHPPTNSNESLAILLPESIQSWYRNSWFTNGKSLSGMPLLFYNSHLLWSCRALEVELGSLAYARMLWGLTLGAMLVDLGVTYTILTMIREANYGSSRPLSLQDGDNHEQQQQQPEEDSHNEVPSAVATRLEGLLCGRNIGSLTVTASAIMFIFREDFPFAPLPILPLPFSTQHLPILCIPEVSYGFCLVILLALSQSCHPIVGVLYGMLSGMFWASGWTSLLMEPYWFGGSLVAYTLLCLLACKAQKSPWIPCIDFVAWDERGRLQEAHPTLRLGVEVAATAAATGPGDSQDDHVNDDDGDSARGSYREETGDVELSLPNGDDDLRHRLPAMDEMEEDGDEEEGRSMEQQPLLTRATSTMRSRRAPTSTR